MDNTTTNVQEQTEVLRISGNVTVPKGNGNSDYFRRTFADFIESIEKQDYHFIGSIVPQDDESGMRLYRVEEVEAKDKQISIWISAYHDLAEQSKANDKLTLSLSEELAQEKGRLERLKTAFEFLENKERLRLFRNVELMQQIQALEKRLELAENKRWITFIKWWKELWKEFVKKFRSTVNQ